MLALIGSEPSCSSGGIMCSRILAAIIALAFVTFVGCSGAPQSDITPNLPQSLRSPSLGRHQRQKPLLTETVIYSFCEIASCADGNDPSAGLTNANGTLYGTTYYGGGAFGGTVFSITASCKETVVHSFGSGSDGVGPSGGLINAGGTLYGTTHYGGGSGDYGTVFSVTPGGTYNLLHSFAFSDGANPWAGLANVRGTLYGATIVGGESGFGTIFSITKSGSYDTLYGFAKKGDCPFASMINVSGVLYGTTYGCNRYGYGTVFKITTSGTKTLLYSFAGGSDGARPDTPLTNVGGVLYGTTDYGGTGSCSAHHESGCGTVFMIDPSTGAEAMLYSFKGGTDGAYPNGLTNVRGTLYGTTLQGGTGCKGTGCGTIFKITTSGTETVLHRFAGDSSDGQGPIGDLINLGGVLYGTTQIGGAHGWGTVFSLSGF
jgi:uncharacterized repeat protein (TIGR03803 family)